MSGNWRHDFTTLCILGLALFWESVLQFNPVHSDFMGFTHSERPINHRAPFPIIRLTGACKSTENALTIILPAPFVLIDYSRFQWSN